MKIISFEEDGDGRIMHLTIETSAGNSCEVVTFYKIWKDYGISSLKLSKRRKKGELRKLGIEVLDLIDPRPGKTQAFPTIRTEDLKKLDGSYREAVIRDKKVTKRDMYSLESIIRGW